MLVEKIMKKNVITLSSTATVLEALQLLQEHRIRHIPIIDKEKHVIGIVSDRDVRVASPSILDKQANQQVLKKGDKRNHEHPSCYHSSTRLRGRHC